MTDRSDYWDLPPGSIIVGGAKRQPRVASQLLEDLDVAEAPLATQRDAVARWLADNEPNALLRFCLEEDGLMPAHTSTS